LSIAQRLLSGRRVECGARVRRQPAHETLNGQQAGQTSAETSTITTLFRIGAKVVPQFIESLNQSLNHHVT
jgi:hypothetical protein